MITCIARSSRTIGANFLETNRYSILKQVGMRLLHPSFLVFRFCLRIRFIRRGVPKHQIASYFILRRYLLLCQRHKIETWASDGTLLGAIRNRKFAGRPGDLDFLVKAEDSAQLQNLISKSLFGKFSFIRWLPLFRQTFAIEIHPSLLADRIYRKIFVLGKMLQMLEITSLKVSKSNSNQYQFDSSLEGVDFHTLPIDDFSVDCRSSIYDLEIRVFKNPEIHLETLYGTDWRIPRVTKTEVLGRKPHLWSQN